MTEPTAVNFKLRGDDVPMLARGARCAVGESVPLEIAVFGRDAMGSSQLLVGLGADAVATVDDPAIAEVTRDGGALCTVRTRAVGTTVVRATYGSLRGEWRVDVVAAGPLQTLEIWLAREETSRLCVVGVEAASRLRRDVSAEVVWHTLEGNAQVGAAGLVAGQGIVEARIGDLSACAAVARRGDALWLLTCFELGFAWSPGRDNVIFGHTQRSDADVRNATVSIACSDPGIARLHGQRLHPAAPGTATVTLEWEGLHCAFPLRVRESDVQQIAIWVPRDSTYSYGMLLLQLGAVVDFQVRDQNDGFAVLDLLEYVKVQIDTPAVKLVQGSLGTWQLHGEAVGTAVVQARVGPLEAQLKVAVYDPAEVEMSPF